jgi:anti-sigma factor (TIGR02949 family)
MSFFDKLRSLFGDTSPDNGSSAAPMIACEEALSIVHDFLDGELEGVSHDQVKAHFDACQRCYPHLRLEEHYRQAIRRAGSEEKAPDGLKVKLMKLLAEADA